MTTTKHTQTLAQMLKRRIELNASEAIFEQILDEFGRESMACVAWRGAASVAVHCS